MNIHLVDIPRLPFVAALFSDRGKLLVATPEWKQGQDAAVSYPIRNQKLIVNPMERDNLPNGAKVAIRLLLDALSNAAKNEDATFGPRLTMLAAALDIVVGKVQKETGTVQNLMDACIAGVSSRAGFEPKIELKCNPNLQCDSPSALALLLVQLVVNAHVHGGVDEVTIIIHSGKRLAVEWPGEPPKTIVYPSRTEFSPERWGLSFAQIVADTLGGRVYPPRAQAMGIVRTAVEIDINKVMIPIALVSRTQMIEEASSTFLDETSWKINSAASSGDWTKLIQKARANPNSLIYQQGMSARAYADGEKIWLGIPPFNLEARIDSALHGLDHEADLWHNIKEDQAVTIRALSKITQWLRSGEPPTSTRTYWLNHWSLAISALQKNIDPPPIFGNEIIDVNASAWLFAKFGSAFYVNGHDVAIVGKHTAKNDPVWQNLAVDNKLGIAGSTVYRRETVSKLAPVILAKEPKKTVVDPWE